MEAALGTVCAPAARPSFSAEHTYCTCPPGREGEQREPRQLSELPAERQAQCANPLTTAKPQPRRRASSTDFIASALTRRFGLAGGLLWVGVLTFGVVSEQVKTRLEVRDEGQSEAVDGEDVRTEHSTFRDLKIGGGRVMPERGLLVLLDYRLTAGGQILEDTEAKGRPALYTFGSRPLPSGLCVGVEEALASMRAGGRREVIIPPGRGQDCSAWNETEALVYDIRLLRVSVPPS